LAIRRRRPKLTNLLSTMDTRLKRVEFQPINLLTESQVQSALALGEDEELTGREGIVAVGAPNSYKRIFDAYIYSDKANGNESGTTVELWVEAKTGASNDNNIEVSGVRRASGAEVDVSGKFKLIEIDTSPWEGRQSFRATPPGNIAESLYYSTGVAAPNSWSTSRQLQTKRQISKYSATTTSVTLTMNADHSFKAGDIISVDLEDADIRLFGVDGLFRVKSVTSNTIVYDFDVPIEEPINEATLALPRFVYPVVREFIRDGATWIQEGGEDGDVVWVWKDYRWVNIRTYTGSDGVAPNPVTNLVATSKPNREPGAETGTATIKLTWDAPTKDVKGRNLTDLAGYAVWFRQDAGFEWKKEEFTGNDTVWEGSGFQDGEEAFFRVYARDSGNLLSDFTAVSHTPNLPFDPAVKKPSPPSVITYLGATRVQWNGKDFENAISSRNTYQIELHWSTIPDFTPVAGTLYERLPAIPGGVYVVIPNRQFGTVNESLPEGTTQNAVVYFKFVAVDVFGKPTAASDQTVATVQLNKIVRFAELDVDSFVGKSITGATYQTNENVSTTGGILFTKDFFATFSPGGAETFRINAKTGAVTIGGGLGLSALNTLNAAINDPTSGLEWTRGLAISANGLAAVANTSAGTAYSLALTANGLAFTANTRAGSAYNLAVTAEGIAITAGTTAGTANTRANNAYSLAVTAEGLAVTANSTAGTAITRINAGNVTIQGARAINAINDDNTTTIAGGKITTGTLNANRITSGTIPASVAITHNGDYRTTTEAGRRVTIDGSTNTIQFNSSAGNAGFIRGQFGTGSINGVEMGGVGGSACSVMVSSINAEFRGGVGVTSFFRVLGTNTDFSYVGGPFRITQLAGTEVNLRVGAGGVVSRGTSDQRLKKDISPTDLGLNFINKLNPVSFKWDTKDKSDKKFNYGLIAQEVEQVLNEIGDSSSVSIVAKYRNEHGDITEKLPENDIIYGLDYEAFIAPLIKSIQELSAKVEYLENKNDTSEGTR
jgi:hypothetical protein